MKRVVIMLLTGMVLGNMAFFVSAASDPLDYWGYSSAEIFAQMETIEHNGMAGDAQIRYRTNQNGTEDIFFLTPQKNTLRFVWKQDADQETAIEKSLEILEKYYPGIQSIYRNPSEGEGKYKLFREGNGMNLCDLRAEQGDNQTASAVMHDLAQAELISEFYPFGECMLYNELEFGGFSPNDPLGYGLYGNNPLTEEQAAAVRAWLTEHDYEYSFVWNSEKDFTGTLIQEGYYLTPNYPTSFHETMLAAADIYEEFGLKPYFEVLSDLQSACGVNAMTLRGDINIDNAHSVADAVLLARVLAEDTTAPVTQAGLANADVNGNGELNMQDLSALLKQIADT